MKKNNYETKTHENTFSGQKINGYLSDRKIDKSVLITATLKNFFFLKEKYGGFEKKPMDQHLQLNSRDSNLDLKISYYILLNSNSF